MRREHGGRRQQRAHAGSLSDGSRGTTPGTAAGASDGSCDAAGRRVRAAAVLSLVRLNAPRLSRRDL
ncbi:hypothetical protein OG788_32560 [Streptomyces sp. NBC_00647]|uniref:hypothetical protein n=1 Tax=Streptomyces sp. NBC_00647 TaxID=2975796 RepID=UPI003244123F